MTVACPSQRRLVTLDHGPTRLRPSDVAVSTIIRKSTQRAHADASKSSDSHDADNDDLCPKSAHCAHACPADGSARRRPGSHSCAADRPHGAADPGAPVSAHHRARCPQRQGAAAIRGEGAAERAQRAHRADRRHGLRPVERLRRAHPHADGGAPGQRAGCATTSSTPRRSARRRARRCSPAATIT